MPLNNNDPSTYDIRIDDFQRNALRKCIHHTLMTMPAGMWLNADEKKVAEQMFEFLNPTPADDTLPLQTDGINSFVL